MDPVNPKIDFLDIKIPTDFLWKLETFGCCGLSFKFKYWANLHPVWDCDTGGILKLR